MKYFEVGQTVWHFDNYLGVISGVVSHIHTVDDYPIFVDFGKCRTNLFTIDGRSLKSKEVSLFQTKPIITPNVPIFEERPAYFWSYDNNVWFYDILVSINIDGLGKSKTKGCLYDKWQFNAPKL